MNPVKVLQQSGVGLCRQNEVVAKRVEYQLERLFALFVYVLFL